MFSGILLLCDGVDRLSSGKFLIMGTYNNIAVQGWESVHNFTFYCRIMTEYRGKIDFRFRFFRRQEGQIRPDVDLSLSTEITQSAPVDIPSLNFIELPFQVPQARLVAPDEIKAEGEPAVMFYDVVLSAGEYEIARTSFSVQFIPPVTVTRI